MHLLSLFRADALNVSEKKIDHLLYAGGKYSVHLQCVSVYVAYSIQGFIQSGWCPDDLSLERTNSISAKKKEGYLKRSRMMQISGP